MNKPFVIPTLILAITALVIAGEPGPALVGLAALALALLMVGADS